MSAPRKPIRWGMVGGGQGGFIGAVHRMAARLDGHYELVAGALSSDPGRAASSAAEAGIAPERSYETFEAMAETEAGLPDGIEAVSIVTPNHLHFPAAKAFLAAGIHVICDKPVTRTLDEAIELARLIEASGRLFVLTHNYTGYPLVRQARDMVAEGALGALRLVVVEYAQDWLAEPLEHSDAKGAQWRTDPARSGAGGAIGDIGTHAYNLAAFVCGIQPSTLLAELTSFVPGRRLDDNGAILLRYDGGVRGQIWASQVAVGHENGLALRVFGEKGGLEWRQEEPNTLWFAPLGQPRRAITRGIAATGPSARRVTRLPPGHPEGYLEAFATIYSEAALAIAARREGAAALPPDVLLPTIGDGVDGLRFIAACVRSSQSGGVWVPLAEE